MDVVRGTALASRGGMMRMATSSFSRLSAVLLFVLTLGLMGASGCEAPAAMGASDATLPFAVEQWEWCPLPTPSPPPNEEALWVQFSPQALYCAQFSQRGEVEEELARKSQLRLVPGDHFWPLEPGRHTVELGSCLRFAGDGQEPGPTPIGPATLDIESTTSLGQTRITRVLRQPLVDQSAEDWVLRITFSGEAEALKYGMLLDGTSLSARREPSVRVRLCKGQTCGDDDDRRDFDACAPNRGRRGRHRLAFEGGSVDITTQTEGSSFDYEGRVLVAEGELRGRRFEQRDYWKVAMHPSYSFSDARDFMVAFDEPIGNACGVVVERAYPYPNAAWGTSVSVIRCDDQEEWEPRTLYTVNWEWLDEPNDALP